ARRRLREVFLHVQERMVTAVRQDIGSGFAILKAFLILQHRRCCPSCFLQKNQVKRVLRLIKFGHRSAGSNVPDIGEVEGKQSNQDEHAAQEGIQEELDGCIFPVRPAPNANKEVHRQQHDFTKDVKQEKVQRQEGTKHACFQDQKQHAIAADVLGDI